MKPSHYLIIFIMILASFTILISTTTDLNVNISEEDEKIREILYAGAEDALVKTLEEQNYPYDNEKLWSEYTVQVALDSLNDHFENRLNYDINDINDTTDYLFPVVCFLDSDGYYLRFIGTENDETVEDKKVESGLFTWTKIEESGGKKYNLQYHLGTDILTVTDESGMTTTGTYDEINELLDHPFFFNSYRVTREVNGEEKTIIDADSYNKDKENYMILKTEEMINYYLNNKTTTVQKLGKHIELSFDINDDALHQAFHNVGLAIFMQGPVFNNSYNKTPICGFAHYEYTEIEPCMITLFENELYYHNKNCTEKDVQDFYGYARDTKEAAELGASPCITCY